MKSYHYQIRRYHARRRHITLAGPAHAFLAVTKATAPKAIDSGLVPSPTPTSTQTIPPLVGG